MEIIIIPLILGTIFQYFTIYPLIIDGHEKLLAPAKTDNKKCEKNHANMRDMWENHKTSVEMRKMWENV